MEDKERKTDNVPEEELREAELRNCEMLGGDIRRYVALGLSSLQLGEVRKGLEEGIPVEGYLKPEWDWEKMAEYRKALEENINLDPYLQPDMDYRQLEQIRLGLKDGLSVVFYANPELDAEQMKEIRLGMEEKLDITLYAKKEYSALQMREIRKGLMQHMDIQEILSPSMDFLVMREIRHQYKNGIKDRSFIPKNLDSKGMRQVRKGLEAGLDLTPYANEGYHADQLEEVRLAFLDGCDLRPYLEKGYSGAMLRQMYERWKKDGTFPEEDFMSQMPVQQESRVDISEDRMSAMLVYSPEEGKKDAVTVSDLKDFLKANGVNQGIMEDVLEKIVKEQKYGKAVEVAVGKAPTEGKDGEFHFHVEQGSSGKPRILPNGSVDYKNISRFVMVKKGELLAEYIPATPGEYGYTVDGKFLMPKRGKEKPPLKGKGFLLSEDRRMYTAAMTGKVEVQEDRIEVSDICNISGDVDMSVGNLNFDGDIVITGNVCQGMTVRATGNIQIQGHVEGAVICAGKDVILANGMQGAGECLVQAGHDVSGKFFEYATIRAGHDIVSNYLLNCDAQAGGSILISGRRGMIIGGISKALERIEATSLGNDVEVPTTVELGMNRNMVARYSELEKQIEKTKKEIDLLTNNHQIFVQRNQADHPTCVLIEKALDVKEKECQEYLEEKKELSEQFTKCRNAAAIVHSSLYPGCRIVLNMEILVTTQEYRNVCVKLVKRKVTVLPE
ncbi:MAG: FapA family protein [Clostridiales bacterium]|nr:FapA family protein [Clostridiales bacterium]